MLNITLICTGGLRETYFRDAAAEYEKRLGAFCRFRAVELAPTADTTDSAMARRILSVLPERSYNVALCVEGKQLSSAQLAQMLERIPGEGFSEAAFVIGGSDGLPDEVKAACRCRMSFSPMTFPHQLMRVVLLEQIYRSYRIIQGEPYHK